MSRAQSAEATKKEAAKKPVLGKFGNLFSSTKKRSVKNSPTSPTSPNCEKTVSPTKDVASTKSSEKEPLKDRIRSSSSVTTDSKGRTQTIAKVSLETVAGSPRKRVTATPPSKQDPVGKSNHKEANLIKDGEAKGLALNHTPDGDSPPLVASAEKETGSEQSASGLARATKGAFHAQSPSKFSAPIQVSILANKIANSVLNGAPGPEGEATKGNGNTAPLNGKEVSTAKETNKTSSRASTTNKKTVSSVATNTEVLLGNSETRKAKPVFRVNKGLDQEKSSPSFTCDLNPKEISPPEATSAPSVKQTQVVPEKTSEVKDSSDTASESTNPAKVLTVDIYLTKAVESSEPPVPLTLKESTGDADLVMERRSSGKKSSKKRRSFRFNANQNDDQPPWESPAVEEAVSEGLPTSEEQKEAAAAPEDGAKSPQQPPEPSKQDPKAGANHKVSPRGDSDKSKQQLPPPASPSKRKAARENQPTSPVPASPTARKSQTRDPASKSPPGAEGCTPAWPVTTTKGAGAAATPQGPASGSDSPKTPPEELAERGSADSPGEPRKLQRENSTGAGKRAALHTEVRAAGKRELEKSTERLAAASLEAARQKSSAVIGPRNTVTTKLHIPVKPKNVDLNLKTKRAESLESVEEIGVEQQINRGNTANKISLFENKSSSQSHRQIDFYATKSIPLTKKFVGRAKLKFGKQAKESEQVDQSASKQSSSQKSPEDEQPVGKTLHEIKLKFETAMEVDTVDKAEVGKGTSPRKKGKGGSPQPAQLQKPDFQDFSYSQAETVSPAKEDMEPNAASLPPQQIHEQINKDIFMEMKEQNSELSQITHPPVESNTETGNTSTLHEADSSQVNNLPAEVTSSPLSFSSKNSDVSAVEQVSICVETSDSITKSQDTKTSVKAPTRRGERSMGKKNDRQKKKQPSGSEVIALPEHVKVHQPMESAEKGTRKDDVSGKPIMERANESETVASTSDTESTPVKADVSHGEKTSRNSPDSLTNSKIGKSKKYLDVNLSVENQTSEENTTSLKNEANTLQEITNAHKPMDSSSLDQPNISLSKQAVIIYGSVSKIAVQQISTSSVDADVALGGGARATPGSDMLEFAGNTKESKLNAFETSTKKLSCLEFEDNERNAEVEQNQSSVAGSCESTKKEIFENGGGAADDSNASAFISTRESTQHEQLSCGENAITSFGENAVTNLNDSTSLTRKESTTIDLTENTQLFTNSGTPYDSELQDSLLPQQSALHMPAARLASPEEAGSRLQEASYPVTGDATHVLSASLPDASDTKASDSIEAVTSFIQPLQDSSDVSQSEEKIGGLEIGEAGVNLQTEEKDLQCSVDSEIQSLSPEATEHSDPSAVGVAPHLENVSSVQQSKDDMVHLKSRKSEDSLPHVTPVKMKQSDSSIDPENISTVVSSYDNVPVEGAVPLPNTKDNTSEKFAQKEIQLTGPQTDEQEEVPLVNGPVDTDEEKMSTASKNTAIQTAETKSLNGSEINSHAHSSKEMEPRDYEQMSVFTEPSTNIILPNPYPSLTDYKLGTQTNENTFQNDETYAASLEHDLSHSMSFQKHNVSPKMSDLYSTNSHIGNLENGFSFDRPGMFNPRSPGFVFNVSAASDDSSLDSSSEMERFTEIIRQLDSPISLPQKRKKQRPPRPPQPSFGLPPIHEDYLEKIIDSDKFTFGLGKKERATDLAPALMLKMQNIDAPTRVRPKRASTEQSFLLKSLRSSNKEVPLPNEEVDGKENTVDITDLVVKRSRLEKSTILSTLKSPLVATSKESVFSPTATTINTITTSFATSQKDSSFANPKSFDTVISSQMPPEPEVPQTGIVGQIESPDKPYDRAKNSEVNFANSSSTDFKVPSYMEKYLKTDDEKQAQNLVSVFPTSDEGCRSLSETDFEFASAFGDRQNVSGPRKSTPKPQLTTFTSIDEEFSNRLKPTNLPETNQIVPSFDVETCIETGQEKINPRPGKVVIFGEPNFCGNVVEIYADVPDCTSWELSPVISIKIVRGCWLLYEKPNFEGLSIPLEEGEMELTNLWGEEVSEEKGAPLTVIGSLRQVVKDYRICQIDLFTEADGLGLVTSYFDDTEEVQVFDRLQKTCSIKVHWGVWLIYEDAGFQGVPFILEPGEYPNLAFWDTHEAYIGSMRPLKMGGRKVEVPNEPKIFVYEKPFFEGKELELDGEMFNVAEDQTKSVNEHSEEGQSSSFATVASIRVLGGIWVGYEKPGFEGHQYLLEEGDYPHWRDWGGYNDQLQSFRPVLAEFSTSHMIMYSDEDFGEKGSNINVLGIISNMEDTGYGLKTQSINVLSGVWIAYENADFTGEQYVLEKGKYSSFKDWGAKSFKISSVQPIALDAIGCPMGKFKVLLFSEPDFQGIAQIFEDNINEIDESFVTRSCRVLAGRWVAFDGVDFGGHQYILEEGTYPDLCSMGCQEKTSFRSLHIIDYEFSEPNMVLYEKQHFKGKKIEFASETVNLQSMGYSTRVASVEVLGGIWVIYEHSNYRGRQLLLSPDKIPDWSTISRWRTVGSLRPLIQKRVYFKIRNKSTGLFVATNGNLDDLKLLRLQVTEDTGAEDQIWAYHEGFLKCRIAEDCCVAVSGSIVTSGSKLSLTLEEEKTDSQYWSVSPEGKIHSRLKPNLVLDIKGGTQYDQKHIILSTIAADKETQCWELLVL